MHLWVAEGFIQHTGHRVPENVAEEYLDELINRDLIQVASRRTDGGVKTCRIHYHLRDLCTSESADEKFLEVSTDVNLLSANQSRRLSIQGSIDLYIHSNPSHPSRSLLFLGQHTYDFDPNHWKWVLDNFKLVRMLSFGCVDLYSIPTSIEDLFHLRYLGIESDALKAIPASIGNLINLETLDFRGTFLNCLPKGIWKLGRLRNLYMSGPVSLPNHLDPNDTALKHLQVFSTVSLNLQTVSPIASGRIPNLTKLGIWFASDENISEVIDVLKCLNDLSHLQTLKIINCLERPSLPVSFPPAITKITLRHVRLKVRRDMKVLGKLLNLKILKLRSCLLSSKFYVFGGSFPRLQVLKLENLRMKKWKQRRGAMPCLKHLVIKQCMELVMLPSQLQSLTVLQNVEVLWSTSESALMLQKLQMNVGFKLLIYPPNNDSNVRFAKEMETTTGSTDEVRHIMIRNMVPQDAKHLCELIRQTRLSFFEIVENSMISWSTQISAISSMISRSTQSSARIGDDVSVDLINAKAVGELKEIADRMLRSGYEKEFVQAYSSVPRDALDERLAMLGIDKLSIEEGQMNIGRDSLEGKMRIWIEAVKNVSVFVSREKSLCDHIFHDADGIKEICFNETVKGFVMQLLNLGEAVAIGIGRLPENLFRILDMQNVMADALPDLEAMVTDEFVINKAKGVLGGLVEAARGTFVDVEFKNAVQSDTSKIPMQSGDIHPLTRYVMNNFLYVVQKGKDKDLGEVLGDNFESFIFENSMISSSTQISARSMISSSTQSSARIGDDVSVDLINAKAVGELKELADRMLRSGYEKEFVQAYSSVQRGALGQRLAKLGINKLSIEEGQKNIEWDSLEGKMRKWTQAVKIVRDIVSREKRLCDHIFHYADGIKEICFNEIVKGCVMQLLSFGEAVAFGRRSPQKLLRLLDMYDVMADALHDLEAMVTDEFVINEAVGVLWDLGEEINRTFVEFKRDVRLLGWCKN
ncbi:uncharacterized protein LOC133875411 [Alnus glutinosa]|uniref:uncharacterized protein LOC133875411 n=1 Tax=Alnus glutinosa TaxID=3517 RepID=UPI002D76C3AC|nr:uncharacterized protein LOC133875411 [Alnus glutinosa]